VSTPENKVKRKIKEWYDANLPGHWRVSPRGGPFGKQGASDDILCWLGFFIAVEVKSDVGELSPMQLKNLRDVQKAGGVAAVVKGYDVARLNQIKSIVQAKHDAMIKGAEYVVQGS
jgi:hypothetical protein